MLNSTIYYKGIMVALDAEHKANDAIENLNYQAGVFHLKTTRLNSRIRGANEIRFGTGIAGVGT